MAGWFGLGRRIAAESRSGAREVTRPFVGNGGHERPSGRDGTGLCRNEAACPRGARGRAWTALARTLPL